MSAICGIVHFDDKPVGQADLESMVESSPGRGPDGCAYYTHENAGFAHLAFHVTTESVHEKQPLLSNDGQLVLVADVRLDNREQLFNELDISPFQGSIITDPDLILHSFRKWGTACVEHLLGDFVFSIWDKQKKTLFLARDPLGAYGISYHRRGSTLIFASETAALLDFPGVNPQVNEDVVLKTLAGLQMASGETFFESVHYLPPAHCMLVSAAQSRTWKYWELDPQQQISYRNDDEYTDHFLELLNQAVANRLRSIGPVGISLSGGSDSTLLAAITAQQMSTAKAEQRLKSFSYVFDQFPECDERKYIEPVVRQYDIEATYINTDQYWTFSNIEKTPIPRDFFWSNCFVQLPQLIAKTAGDSGCRTLVDGMFGDALFCEPSLYAADLIQKGRLISLLQLLRQNPDRSAWKQDLIEHGLRPLLPGWLRNTYRHFKPVSIRAELPGLTEAKLRRLKEFRQEEAALTNKLYLSPGRKTRYKRVFQTIWEHGFAATRSNPYNQNGIERVSPYFDRRLVEYVLAIPTEKLSNSSRPRKLQNDAMRRLLPAIVHQRTEKTSFERLLRIGVFEREKTLVDQLTDDSLIAERGWVNGQWLKNQTTQVSSGNTDIFALSQYLHLELWLNAIKRMPSQKQKWSAPYFYKAKSH